MYISISLYMIHLIIGPATHCYDYTIILIFNAFLYDNNPKQLNLYINCKNQETRNNQYSTWQSLDVIGVACRPGDTET